MEYTLELPDGYIPPVLPGRDEWVRALRSGIYGQCHAQLCDRTGYCCLGVLCTIQQRPFVEHASQVAFDNDVCGLTSANPLWDQLRDLGRLPPGVTVYIPGYGRKHTLSTLNDGGMSFKDVADIIEKVWSHAEKTW